MNKAWRAIKWVAINGAIMACVYYGAFHGEEWGENIATFFIPVSAMILLFWAHAESAKEVRHKARGKGPPVGRSVAGAYDLVLVSMLAAVGWFWLAGFAALGAISEQQIFWGDE